MRLPYLLLPRDVYDDLRTDLMAARTQLEEVQKLLIDLKLDGAQVMRYTTAPRKPKIEPTSDPIQAAIDAHPKCQRMPAMARRFRAWADQMIAERKPESWIVNRIENWDKVDPATIEDEDEQDRREGLISA